MYIMYLMYEKYVFLMLRQYGLRATSTRPSQLIPMSVHAMQTQGANPTYKKKKHRKKRFYGSCSWDLISTYWCVSVPKDTVYICIYIPGELGILLCAPLAPIFSIMLANVYWYWGHVIVNHFFSFEIQIILLNYGISMLQAAAHTKKKW